MQPLARVANGRRLNHVYCSAGYSTRPTTCRGTALLDARAGSPLTGFNDERRGGRIRTQLDKRDILLSP
jgi:hypothetical protein